MKNFAVLSLVYIVVSYSEARYVNNNPINYVDPMGTTAVNLTGHPMENLPDPTLQSMYDSLNNDPNFLVLITNTRLPNQLFGNTVGDKGLVTEVQIDPRRQTSSGVFYNTLAHELTHAIDMRNGNVSSIIKSQTQNIGLSEPHAVSVADRMFSPYNTNKCGGR